MKQRCIIATGKLLTPIRVLVTIELSNVYIYPIQICPANICGYPRRRKEMKSLFTENTLLYVYIRNTSGIF